MSGLQPIAGTAEATLGLWQESFGILASDGATIPVHRWLPRGAPQAIVIISHGLAEHALRYRWTATNLASRGCAVYANDHRGHGQAAMPGRLGDFGQGGFAGLVEDLRQVVWLAATENPGTPLFLLGHSMGAFAAQLFAIENSHAVSGIVMSGGSALDLLHESVGKKDPEEISRDATFSAVDAPFQWLSRDPAVVDRYLDDPLCGFAVAPASRDSFYAAGPRLRDPAELRRIRPDLPMLMLSGERDPINGFLHHFGAQIERYRHAGLRNLTARIYPGARHEVLNETNREEVLCDLFAWLQGSLQERGARADPGTAGSRRRTLRRTLARHDA